MANKKKSGHKKNYYTAQYSVTKKNKLRRLNKRLNREGIGDKEKKTIEANIKIVRDRPNKQKSHRKSGAKT